MRIFFLILTWLTLAQTISAQFTSLVVFVTDELTGTPLPNSAVTIKEADFNSKMTGGDGKVFFNKSIPIGEIHYIVTNEAYKKLEGTFNITTESKSNTLLIKLSKQTKLHEDRILIQGEVLDANDKELENALIEVKVADLIKNAITDRSGNYQIEIILDKTIYDINTVFIEAKTGSDCRVNKSIELTRKNLIHIDFKLNCGTKEELSISTRTFEAWNTYQSILQATDSILINPKSTVFTKKMIIEYNELILTKLKRINLEHLERNFVNHLREHIILGDRMLSWLKFVDGPLPRSLKKDGVNLKRDLFKLLEHEKKLATYLENFYGKSFFISHLGTGFI